MMRNIEFRGLHKSGWVYGYVRVGVHDGSKVMIQQKESCSDVDEIHHSVTVDAKTVGQFTGLTDKNGVKIFEGDIYMVDGYGLCVVNIEPLYGVVFERIDGGVMTMLNVQLLDLDYDRRGNKHENPELLEQ